MMKNCYISERDKRYISNYCKNQISNGDKIRVKALAVVLEEKYCLYEIMKYIKKDLNIDPKCIFHGEADYISKLPRGHIQLVNDLFYDRDYLHQYIVTKELDIKREDVKKYIIHHIDQEKQNNNISNLWIFFDAASHIEYHGIIDKGIKTDIHQFTMDYVDRILNKDNTTDIENYLEILEKWQKKML